MLARNRWSPRALALAVVGAFVVFGAGGLFFIFLPGGRGPEQAPFMIIFVPFVATGAAVIARQPANLVGWLLAGVGLSTNLWVFIDGYAIHATLSAPGSLPFGPAFAWLSNWVFDGAMACLLFTMLLFPTGRLASPRWRPVAWLIGAVFLFVLLVFAFSPIVDPEGPGLENPLGLEAIRPLAQWVNASFWLFIVMFGLAVASVVARFRASRGVERQQLKWAAAGCALAVGLFALSSAFSGGLLANVLWALAIIVVPLSVAFAMLRYRLYDIDVLINRTLVYGAVSALLAGTYVLIVLALSTVLRPLTGSGDIAVAGSTLAVVALFQPIRARMQRFVDRRFYRARYDAARTVDAFSARLRDQVDLDALRGELVAVVHDTVKPAHVSLWMRRTGDERFRASSRTG